jgi:CheY-like chemotaxis protein
MLLVKKGLAVDTCENGQEAIDLICNEKRDYDVIFMDNTMPVMVIYLMFQKINTILIVYIYTYNFRIVWNRSNR